MKITFLRLKNIFNEYFISSSLPSRKLSFFLIIIISCAIIFRLLIFYNTNVFAFSDCKIYYSNAFNIAEGQEIPVFTSFAPLTISHMGAWFIKNLGSINYWFYLNILMSALTIMIIWLITKKITCHSGIANLTSVLLTFHTMYAFHASIYYTQIVMVFLASLIILLLMLSYASKSILSAIVYTTLGSLVFIVTLFFKWELLYLYIFVGISSIFFYKFKYKRQALVSILFFLTSFSAFHLANFFYKPMEAYTKYGSNVLFFCGHSPYSGGEGVFLDHMKEKYKSGLEEYTRLHSGEFNNRVLLVNAYHNMLVKDFITNHPDQWAALQVKKFFRTLGIKPDGISYKIFASGKIQLPLVAKGIILTVPFWLTFVLCIFLFDWTIFKKLFKTYVGIFMLTLFVYFIIATIFYPHYQIRYRLPLEVFFLCPAAATFIVAAFTKNSSLTAAVKKHFKWKLIVFIIFVFAWVYEVYDIFYLNRDRYITNAEKYEQGIIP